MEREYTIEDLKAAHYAGWYNGLVNAYTHQFSWSTYYEKGLTPETGGIVEWLQKPETWQKRGWHSLERFLIAHKPEEIYCLYLDEIVKP